MMTDTMISYIHQQLKTIPHILHGYQQTLKLISDFSSGRKVQKILILATGSSYNAALCARYYFIQQCHLLAEIKEPYSFTHYERLDPQTDMVLVISQSGKSASTCAAQNKAQQSGIPVFTLTSDSQSPLASASSALLDMNTGIETVGFVTMGFTATIVNLLLIASLIALHQGTISASQHEELLQSLAMISDKLAQVIDKTECFIQQHQQNLTAARQFIAIGYGALEGVVSEFATKFTETVRLPSNGFELEAYMHGPYLGANSQQVLFFLEDKSHNRLHALRDYMQPYVRAVYTLSGEQQAADNNTLALDFSVPHNLSPLLLTVPIQLLAYRISAMRHIDLSVRIFDDFDQVLKSKI